MHGMQRSAKETAILSLISGKKNVTRCFSLKSLQVKNSEVVKNSQNDLS